MPGAGRFVFLNESGAVRAPRDWNDPARSKLWLYNLHYFDDLNAQGAYEREAWHRELIERWIADNPTAAGIGWEPYPTSLRIVNWIKWFLSDHRPDPGWLQSLAVQTRHLVRRLEWHLLGNHLLANGKALIFAGCFFGGTEADRWFGIGSRILRDQLTEQVLADGGHFELSPMYHAIVLEDLLDIMNALDAYGLEGAWPGPALVDAVGRMRAWLAAMVHPDGGIAFFNDAAFGIAATRDELEPYAGRLGLASTAAPRQPLHHLAASGYVRMAQGDAVVIADVAEVGPAYLPGHAHADTLSFEMSLGTERIIVNGGTSLYGTGANRQAERSTASHSTVEIDAENSSEVWGGFRMARRAHVSDARVSEESGECLLQAAHDGYTRLSGRPVHHRSWCLQDGRLTVTDSIRGRYSNAVARFHLGKGVTAMIDVSRRSGTVAAPTGRKLCWSSNVPARIEPSAWHPEFGRAVPIQCLTVPVLDGHCETIFTWSQRAALKVGIDNS